MASDQKNREMRMSHECKSNITSNFTKENILQPFKWKEMGKSHTLIARKVTKMNLTNAVLLLIPEET